MIKVAKFGGTSLANAEQFRKVREIVSRDPARRFIVCSAGGKETAADHKVTDLLYLCEAHIRYGVSYEPLFSLVADKYRRIHQELGLTFDLEAELELIRSRMSRGIPTDYLVSRGEYLTGRCLAEYLGFDFVDAKDVVAFGYDGRLDLPRSQSRLDAHCGAGGVVIPGFYGALPDGTLEVMSRGGSDITGALIANLVNADVYENWTDVSGFFVADPKIVADPVRIPAISYSELREMSYLGANVLHDDAIFPVKSKNIPINIRNTNDPDDPGTLIMGDCTQADQATPPHAITGITGRRDFTVITIAKSHSSAEVGFLRKILTVFEEYRVSVESVPITVDTFSVIVDSRAVSACLYDIVRRLKEEFAPDELRVETGMALVAVVGRAMKEQPGMSGRLLSEFGRSHINIKVISQSSDELCIVVGVMNQDLEKAIRCLYAKFILEDGRPS